MIHPHDLFSPMEPWTIRVVKFADELTRKGHEVTIVYFPITWREESFSRGVRLIPLDRTISAAVLIKNTVLLCGLSRRADVIHFQKSQFYAALPAVLAAYWAWKPLHYDWDDWEEKIFYASIRKKTATAILTGISFRLMERLLPFLADSVSVSSEALRALALQRGANEKNIFSAPVGADLQQFCPDRSLDEVRKKHNVNGALLVLYHGQLHSCQYVRLFLKAIRLISKTQDGNHLRFMIMGGGSELMSLKMFAQELGIGGKVVFTGFVPHMDISRYIAAADICVAPFDDNEVTRCKSPLKIVEYMASGKPVVASDVGEVRNMLEGAGLLVEPGKSEAIVHGILELAGDKMLRKTMAAAARQRAETKYRWCCSAENLEKAYYANVCA
jgi:glycosyltransferase involved in cell wall biosynthesis